jgi:hypothetical protein
MSLHPFIDFRKSVVIILLFLHVRQAFSAFLCPSSPFLAKSKGKYLPSEMLNGFSKMSKGDFCQFVTSVFTSGSAYIILEIKSRLLTFLWPCKKSTRFNRLKKVAKSVFCLPE